MAPPETTVATRSGSVRGVAEEVRAILAYRAGDDQAATVDLAVETPVGEGEQTQKQNKTRRAESRSQHSGLASCYTFEDHTIGRGGKRGRSAFYDACSSTKSRAGYLYVGTIDTADALYAK